LTTGVLRWRGRLDYCIGQAASKPVPQLHPLVLDLLRLTAYQLLFLDRIPPHAAVAESVQLAKKRHLPPALVAFVNAVSRTLAQKIHSLPLPDRKSEPVAALAAAASLPPWLASRWLENLGEEAAWPRAAAANQQPPLTIRINTSLISRETLKEVLEAEGVAVEPCRYSPVGLILHEIRQPPLSLPSYQRGLWIFQDEAAQLATMLLQPEPGQQILEIGAGRGGKTTHLAQIIAGRGNIVAVDTSRTRLQALQSNLKRMALTEVQLLLADATASLPLHAKHRFARILIDAPCSGLGILRRHPELRWRRQPTDFSHFAALQRAILSQAAPYLAPGGILLYITCTTASEENEQVIHEFLEQQPEFTVSSPAAALPPEAQQLIEPPGYFRTLPEREGLDGFFAVALLKGNK
jgi:16S rRNA (cytosine967-C5)-methyltransferase